MKDKESTGKHRVANILRVLSHLPRQSKGPEYRGAVQRFREGSRHLLTQIFPKTLRRNEGIASTNGSVAEYPLTERLGFITRYVETVSKDHVLSIFRTPGYNMLTPYFGLKIFDGQPEKQMEMLSTISDAFSEGGGYTAAAKNAADLLTSEAYTDSTLSKVSGTDIQRVSLRGPTEVEDKTQKIVKESITEDEIPVIIAYGGLLGLKAAIENRKEGGQIMILIPEEGDSFEFGKGYKLTCSDRHMELTQLTEGDFLTNSKLALIDDSTKSGNTFANIRQLFPQAEISERPIFNAPAS